MGRTILPTVLTAMLSACAGDHSDGTDGQADTSGVQSGPPGSEGTLPTTDTGSTPPTSGPTTGQSDVSCTEKTSVLAVDDPTPLGVSAAEILLGKLTPRSSTLIFLGPFLTPISDTWADRALPLIVTLTYDDGEIRWIDAEANPDNPPDSDDNCFDRLEINIHLDFVTDAGEFNEHRAAIATATSAKRIDVTADLLPPALTGSLDPSTLYDDPNWTLDALGFVGAWEGDAAGGRVMQTATASPFITTTKLAYWGDEELLTPLSP